MMSNFDEMFAPSQTTSSSLGNLLIVDGNADQVGIRARHRSGFLSRICAVVRPPEIARSIRPVAGLPGTSRR